MKKATFFFCILMALTALCSPAQAEPFTGGSVTVDAPEGWTPSFEKSNPDQLRLQAPENRFRMAILPGPSNDMNSEQGARMLAKMLEGTTPAPAPKHPGMYTFTTNTGSLRWMVVAHGQRMVAIMEAGEGLPFQRDIGRIIRSLASADADEQAIFDSLKPFFQTHRENSPKGQACCYGT